MKTDRATFRPVASPTARPWPPLATPGPWYNTIMKLYLEIWLNSTCIAVSVDEISKAVAALPAQASCCQRRRAQLARRSRAAAVVALSDACGGVPHVMGEEHLCDEPAASPRRGKGGVVDGTRAVELGVAALQRSLCTSKHMKMAPLQTHPEACAPTFGHSTRRQRGSCRCSPALVSSRLSSSVRVEGDRRRQSCMFKDLGCTKRFSTKNAPVCAHMTHHAFAAHPFESCFARRAAAEVSSYR